MTTELAHGFYPTLMGYLPELFCFEVKRNSICSKVDYISLLVKASMLNCYAEGTSNVSRKIYRSLTGDTALSYFKSVDRYELQSVSSIVFEWQVDALKRKGQLRRPVAIAFDWHDQMFYGDKESEMVNGTKEKNGSCHAYQYLTASILVDGKRLTIVLALIKSREHMLEYIEDALNRIRNVGVKARHLLFDGGFSSLALPRYLEEHGYHYAIHFTPNSLTNEIGLKDGEEVVYPCGGDKPSFRLVRADDRKTGKACLFATNMTRRPKRVLRRYKLRWGIETTYREHNVFLARTTSKNYTVRLLYYTVAVCIYNAWCILNNAQEERRVIALEVKVSLLIAYLAPLNSANHPKAKGDDYG